MKNVLLTLSILFSCSAFSCEEVRTFISKNLNKNLVAYVFDENEFDELKKRESYGEKVVNHYRDIFSGTFPVYFEIVFYPSGFPSYEFEFMAKNPQSMLTPNYKAFNLNGFFPGMCFMGDLIDLVGNVEDGNSRLQAYRLILDDQAKWGVITDGAFITTR